MSECRGFHQRIPEQIFPVHFLRPVKCLVVVFFMHKIKCEPGIIPPGAIWVMFDRIIEQCKTSVKLTCTNHNKAHGSHIIGRIGVDVYTLLCGLQTFFPVMMEDMDPGQRLISVLTIRINLYSSHGTF